MAVHESVITGLITEIRRLIGSRLSNLPLPPNSAPDTVPLKAVIRDRTKGLRPSYPYIVVDLISSDEATPYKKHEYFDTTLNKQVYVNEQMIPISISCYGDNGLDILNELRIRLDYGIDRAALNTATGAVFNYFSDIADVPAFLSTDFVECASMTAIFRAETRWSPEGLDAKDVNGVVIGQTYHKTLDKSDDPVTRTLSIP